MDFLRNAGIQFVRENGIGSTVQVNNNTGIVQDRFEYDAYGITYTLQQNQFTPYLFAAKHGYYSDGDSGMNLLGHRYYLPLLGRFLTQDPIGHEAGLNLYEYCGNNPLVGVDPAGLDWDWNRYFSDVGGVFKGYGSAIVGTLKSPITATEFLGQWSGNGWSFSWAGNSISAMWDNFTSGISGQRGAEGFGDSFGSVLIGAATAGAGFAEGSVFSNVAYVTRWDTPAGISAIKDAGYLKSGAFVQRGSGGPVGYLMSGAAQKGYSFASKITSKVPKSALRAPAGWEKVKGLIGQRQLKTEVPIR